MDESQNDDEYIIIDENLDTEVADLKDATPSDCKNRNEKITSNIQKGSKGPLRQMFKTVQQKVSAKTDKVKRQSS